MANAPFCNIKGVKLTPSPNANALQPVPKATDLASALAAIRALTNNFNSLHSQVKTDKQEHDPTYNPNYVAARGSSTESDWVEIPTRRVKVKIKAKNPDDPEQFIEFEQINSYTMRNKITGELFTWKR